MQVIAGRMQCSVVPNGLEIIQNESDSTDFLEQESSSCRRSVPALAEGGCPSKKTRTAVKVEEVCVRTLPQPIGRAASSGTVSLSQVVQREEFNYIEILIRLLGSQSWWTAVWCFSLAMVAVFLFILFLVCYQC